MTKAILILSHRGKGFAPELIRAARAVGLEAWVLSSSSETDTEKLKNSCDWFRITSEPHLTVEDVRGVIAEGNGRLTACISVWDGYRELMSLANEALGAVDLRPDDLQLLLDKHAFRVRLAEAGLSQVSSTKVTPSNLASLKGEGRKFLKPRRGVASFGAFPLTPDLEWDDLLHVRTSMETDRDYCGVFGNDIEFVAEDYIAGIEYCFEMMASGGKVACLAIHEKVALEELGRTVLESACVSPPVHAGQFILAQGVRVVKRSLEALGGKTGLFHVEARFDGKHWELIEVNPRVGGAYIYHSTKATTGGTCLLELWTRSLLGQTELVEPSWDTGVLPAQSTFFRVFFGMPGKTVSKIGLREVGTLDSPVLSSLSVAAGKQLPASDREVFLGQAMWQMPTVEASRRLSTLLSDSEQLLEVEYA